VLGGLRFGGNFEVNVWRVARGTWSASWVLCVISAFVPEPLKTAENAIDFADCRTMDVYRLLISSPVFKYPKPSGSPYLCRCFIFLKVQIFFPSLFVPAALDE
jgi:hypothetical protein